MLRGQRAIMFASFAYNNIIALRLILDIRETKNEDVKQKISIFISKT